jgi:hypothetical protein
VKDINDNFILTPAFNTFSGDVSPYIKSVSSYSDKEIVIYFSEAIDTASAQDNSNYTITNLTITSAARDSSNHSKVILLTSSQRDGRKYIITVGSVKDLTGNYLSGQYSKEFIGNGPIDTTPPIVLFALLVDENTVEVQYSEPMDMASSEEPVNYTIDDKNGNPVSISTAVRQPDYSKVWIDIDGTFSENLYILKVSTDVQDESANPLTWYPKNIVSFAGLGSVPEYFNDGPVIVNPIGEGNNTFSMLARYRGHIYIGPSDADNAIFRVKPDGSDPGIVSFIFHGEDKEDDTMSMSPGPDREEGINYICGGMIGGTEYLFIGPYKTWDGSYIDYIYGTTDRGSTIEFDYLDVDPYLGWYTKSVSSMIVFNNFLYMGFPNRNPGYGDGPKKPYFVKATSIDPFEALDLMAYDMPAIGYYGGNTTWKLGIDSMCVYNDKLYIANGGSYDIGSNGGIVRSTNNNPSDYGSSPGDWEDITPVGETEWHAATRNRFSIELQKVDRLIPSDKAIPRNTTDGPQLWKYDGFQWKLVADNGSGLTNMGLPGNDFISLLVVNGDRLYIGYDNSLDGVQIWRTVPGTDEPDLTTDFEPVTDDGMGDASNNLRIYHGISIADGGEDYLWLLCGKEGASLRVFRTKN